MAIYSRVSCGRYQVYDIDQMYLYPFSGLSNITPLDCDSMFRGYCVRHFTRGQPAELCSRYTTTPSKIPQGKHVLSVSTSHWSIMNTQTRRWQRLYCLNGSHSLNYSHINYRCHSNVSHSCLTINNAQKNEYSYSFTIYFNPPNFKMFRSIVHFRATYDGTYV